MKTTLDTFQHEAPEVAKAFDGLIDALKSTTGLDGKTNISVSKRRQAIAQQYFSM